MSFWGNQTILINFKEQDIVIIKNALIRNYQGKTLNAIESSKIEKNIPDCKIYKDLLTWKMSNQFSQV